MARVTGIPFVKARFIQQQLSNMGDMEFEVECSSENEDPDCFYEPPDSSFTDVDRGNHLDHLLESRERYFHLRQDRVIGAFQSLYWHMRHVDKADVSGVLI